jgi:hypothetical protein
MAFGARWQAERDTALDVRGELAPSWDAIQSAVAAALCRRTAMWMSSDNVDLDHGFCFFLIDGFSFSSST